MKNRRGLRQKEQNAAQYITVRNGFFVKRVKEETANSRPRELEKGANKGKIVHEELYDEFVGELIDIRVEHHSDFGSFWEFLIDTSSEDNPEETTILKVPYSSGYANNVLFRLPNMELGADALFSAYSFMPKDSDKERKGLTIHQWDSNDKIYKVEPFFTRDEPNGMPELEVKKIKGKNVYDDSERLEYLEDLVDNKIKPKLKGGSAPASTPDSAPATAGEEEEAEPQSSGKVPF